MFGCLPTRTSILNSLMKSTMSLSTAVSASEEWRQFTDECVAVRTHVVAEMSEFVKTFG